MLLKGDKIEFSVVVTEEIYKKFIDTFNDRNPLHTDERFAKEKGFKNVVMHGNILCGFLSYFAGEMLPLKNVMILGQQINFHAPVYLNDKLNFEATLEEFHDSVKTFDFRFTFTNSDSKKIAKGKMQVGIIAA